MDIPIHPGFAVLEISKLMVNETYFKIIQPDFEEKSMQWHNMDTDSFVLGINTNDIVEDLHNINDLFDSSNINRNHEIFSNEKKSKRKF